MTPKTQCFRDKTLSSEAFKALKSSLSDLGAHFVAKKRYGMNAVRLESCKVTLSRPEEATKATSNLTSSELDAHWNAILSVCQEFGFKPQ